MVRSLRLTALAALLAGAVAVAGCGGTSSVASETGNVAASTTEGTYLEVGGLKYQVQISRELNPTDQEDRDYLVGLPSGVTAGPGEIWFGVFMRVENDGDRPEQASSDFTITDTQNNTFRPVPLSNDNAFAYRPQLLQPGTLLPVADSAAASDPIQGSLVLFKLKADDLQNRPLVLHINQGGAGGQSQAVEIDL
jgi:hypothetical protein